MSRLQVIWFVWWTRTIYVRMGIYNKCIVYYWGSLSFYSSIACYCGVLGHPSEPGSSLGFFLGFGLSREFFLATVLLHLHCLLFGGFRLGFCTALCDISWCTKGYLNNIWFDLIDWRMRHDAIRVQICSGPAEWLVDGDSSGLIPLWVRTSTVYIWPGSRELKGGRNTDKYIPVM